VVGKAVGARDAAEQMKDRLQTGGRCCRGGVEAGGGRCGLRPRRIGEAEALGFDAVAVGGRDGMQMRARRRPRENLLVKTHVARGETLPRLGIQAMYPPGWVGSRPRNILASPVGTSFDSRARVCNVTTTPQPNGSWHMAGRWRPQIISSGGSILPPRVTRLHPSRIWCSANSQNRVGAEESRRP
jgi:hypothetical protein